MNLTARSILLHLHKPLIPKRWQRIIVLGILSITVVTGLGQLATPVLISGLPERVYSEEQIQVRKPVTLSYTSASVRSNKPVDENIHAANMRDDTKPWGISKKISPHTWSIQVGQDSHNATPQEIFTALNMYRQQHHRQPLVWDEGLSAYAHRRAASFAANKTLDDHRGFLYFVNNLDGFHQLGFAGLGENSSYGFTLEGVHLIEWVYAGDASHDENQLSDEWNSVGIGVVDTSTDLVFGGNKL